MPRLVREVRVGGHTVDLHAQFIEIGIVVGEITELGRTYEGEISRVEHKHGPLALEGFVRHGHELSVVICGRLEWLDFGIDQRHGELLGQVLKLKAMIAAESSLIILIVMITLIECIYGYRSMNLKDLKYLV